MRAPPETPIPVFISYAREDLAHLNTLQKHLVNLKRQGWIRIWTDQDLLASARWEPELLQELHAARIVLLLVSPDFMASEFIHDVELKALMQRHARNEVRLIPVLLRPTELKGHALSQFQGLPRGFTPITAHANQDSAWVEVASALRTLLEQLEPLSATSGSGTPAGSRPLDRPTSHLQADDHRSARATSDAATSETASTTARIRRSMAPGPSLTLLHLSDLHFGQDRGQATARFDQALVTQALLEDIRAQVKEGLQPDAVLVTGDIAFSGRAEEYTQAEAWLRQVCHATGISTAQLLLVPGNHDVDRKKVTEKKTALRIHQDLRQRPLELDYFLREQDELQVTLWPKLAAFTEFASRLGGPSCSPSRPFWRIELASRFGKPVIVLGLSSCLLSFDEDDGPSNLALGLGQLQPAFQGVPADALVLVLAHHPPEWLLDGAPGGACRTEHALTTFLQKHPHVLFVGHIHQQGGLVAHPLHSGGLLRFVAGAGHEAAPEGGRHAYAWVRMHAEGLDFYPRMWNADRQRFQPERNRFDLETGKEFTRIKRAKLADRMENWLKPTGSVWPDWRLRNRTGHPA